MADAGAGVDIVVAKTLTHQLLHQIGLFIGATRRGDAADGALAILVLQTAEFLGDMGESLLPGNFLPRIGNLLAHHWVKDAILMGGVTPSEAAFDAGMAAIGLPGLVGHHANDFFTETPRLEGANHAA